MAGKENTISPYTIACMQTSVKTCAYAKNAEEGRQIRKENIEHFCEMIDNAVKFWRWNTKICVFPEFSFSGFSVEETIKEWMEKGAVHMPGEETDRLAEKAIEHDLYIVAHGYEVDDWLLSFQPVGYFNTAFMINNKGKLVMKYRKFCSSMTTTPYDILDEYVKKYGWDALFPVVDTPLGKLGMLICCDASVPELWRCLAMKGAEVVLYPTSNPYGTPDVRPWNGYPQVWARINQYYVAVANQGPWRGYQPYYTCGRSSIYGPKGEQVAIADGAEETIIKGRGIDINVVRKLRAQGGSLLSPAFAAEVFAHYYALGWWPANKYLKEPPSNRYPGSIDAKIRKELTDKLIKQGVLKSPV